VIQNKHTKKYYPDFKEFLFGSPDTTDPETGETIKYGNKGVFSMDSLGTMLQAGGVALRGYSAPFLNPSQGNWSDHFTKSFAQGANQSSKIAFQEWQMKEKQKEREKYATLTTTRVMFNKGYRPIKKEEADKYEDTIQIGSVYYGYDKSLSERLGVSKPTNKSWEETKKELESEYKDLMAQGYNIIPSSIRQGSNTYKVLTPMESMISGIKNNYMDSVTPELKNAVMRAKKDGASDEDILSDLKKLNALPTKPIPQNVPANVPTMDSQRQSLWQAFTNQLRGQ